MKRALMWAGVALALAAPSCASKAPAVATDTTGLQALEIRFTHAGFSTTVETFHIARERGQPVLRVTSATGYPPLAMHPRPLTEQQLGVLVQSLQEAPTTDAEAAMVLAARIDTRALRARLASPPAPGACNRRMWQRAVAMHSTRPALQLAVLEQLQHPQERRDDDARIDITLQMEGQPPQRWTSMSPAPFMLPWHVSAEASRTHHDAPRWTLGVNDGLRSVLPEESLAWKRLGPWMMFDTLADQVSRNAEIRCSQAS